MKDWDIDSVECRNLKFKNVRNYKKSLTSKTDVPPVKSDTRSHSTKRNSSMSLAFSNPSNLQDSASDVSTCPTDPPTIPEKQSESSQMQSFLSTATDSNILKSVRTYYQTNKIAPPKLNGELDIASEELPTNVYSENCSKNNHAAHSNEIDSFNKINGNLKIANEEDDVRYSLYYSPTERYSDDEKVDPFDDENLCASPNGMDHSNLSTTVSEKETNNGYVRTRKNMKKHLVKQKKLASVSDALKVKMHNSDKPSSKTNAATKKQISTSELPISKEVTSNGFQRARKSIKNKNLVKQNKLESDSETDASKEMMSDSKNLSVTEVDNPTSDLSSTISKMCLTNIDSKEASTDSKKVAKNCLPTKKMLKSSDSKSYSPNVTVSDPNSTSNRANAINEVPFSSSGSCKKFQTKEHVSATDSLFMMNTFKKFCQKAIEKDVSYPSNFQDNSLKEISSCDFQDKFFDELLVQTEKDQSNNPQYKSSENKRSLSCDRDLNTVKQSRTSCYSSTASTQSLNNTPTLDSCQASKKVHGCSKVKLVNLPIMLCDCGEAQPSDGGNPFLPVLTAHVNKLSSTILMMGTRDPKILRSIPFDQLKRFHDSVERLSELSEIETASELHYLNPPESVAEDDTQNVHLYEQFMNNAFNLHNKCTCKMLNALISDLDACDLLFKVRQFCSSPKVVQFMEIFFAGFDDFPVSSPSEIKFQFQFPDDFENQSFHTVVKDYVRLFAHKIWPKEAETVKGQFVIDFSQQNLSAVEFFVVSSFFKESELYTKTSFIGRFTYVAVLSIYKFYIRMSDE